MDINIKISCLWKFNQPEGSYSITKIHWKIKITKYLFHRMN